MALFGRDYDRDLGYYGGNRFSGYDRAYRNPWNNSPWGTAGRNAYDRDFGYTGMNRSERDFGRGGYDRGFKSRWQTDYGDPFGDRTSRTPMRVVRGGYHPGHDRGFVGRDRDFAAYDRDYYGANPMGYEPYPSREGGWMRGRDRNYRSYGRGGYDAGWF